MDAQTRKRIRRGALIFAALTIAFSTRYFHGQAATNPACESSKFGAEFMGYAGAIAFAADYRVPAAPDAASAPAPAGHLGRAARTSQYRRARLRGGSRRPSMMPVTICLDNSRLHE